MAIYNTPNATDLGDVERIANWVHLDASGGIFFPVMAAVIWFIIFIGSIAEGRAVYRAFIFANFVGIILGAILGLLGWFSVSYLYFMVIMLGFGLVWIKLQKSKF